MQIIVDSVEAGDALLQTQGLTLLSDVIIAVCAPKERREKKIELDGGDTLGNFGAILAGKLVREITTKGDGACSIHAAFGAASAPGDSVALKRPRALLRSILDKPVLQIFNGCRPRMRTLAAFVESALWTEFITPYVKPDGRVVGASGEELKFINRMRMVGNEDLWQSVVEIVGTNLALQQERDEQKRMLESSSSSVSPWM